MSLNQLCGVDLRGYGTYTAEGITKLCEGLKGSAVTSLECAAASCSLLCQCPLTPPPSLGSLAFNQLCGVDSNGSGTYTAEGITKLCEGLKGSAVTSLKCAAAPQSSFSCQRPFTLLNTHLLSRTRSLRGNDLGPEGAVALAKGLTGNSTLQSLG